jgi:hypothetical protein
LGLRRRACFLLNRRLFYARLSAASRNTARPILAGIVDTASITPRSVWYNPLIDMRNRHSPADLALLRYMQLKGQS